MVRILLINIGRIKNRNSNFNRSTSRIRRICVLVLGITRSRNERARTILAVIVRTAETQAPARVPDYAVMRCQFAP